MTAAQKYEAFGRWCFEMFWHDAEPGDIEGGDAQEQAVKVGLLRRRQPGDDTCLCEEFGIDPAECECLWPVEAP